MSHTLTLRLPDELSNRLDRLAAATSRPKSFYVRSLLEEHLAEMEYVAGLDTEAVRIRRGEIETYPVTDLARELGLDESVLRAEGRRELGL